MAFGFRNFSNMRRRIFLYEENWHTKQPTKRNPPKSLSQSDCYCNRRAFACARALQVTDLCHGHPCALSRLFDKKLQLKKKIKTGEKVIEKIYMIMIPILH